MDGDTHSDLQLKDSSLRGRCCALYGKELLSDVCFLVGSQEAERKKIRAHKFILAPASPVFFAMFHGPLAENGEIKIPDIEPLAFEAMLKYLYTDELVVELEHILLVAYCAKKYLLTGLSEQCLHYLKAKLTKENVLSILDGCVISLEDDMANECLEVIDMAASFVLALDSFTEINIKTLKRILERESLQAPEITIFEAAWRWAKAECRRRNLEETGANCRQSLGDALFLIRFSVMSYDDLANIPAKSGLLTKEEICDIFLYHAAKSKPEIKFRCEPRTFFKWKQCPQVHHSDHLYGSKIKTFEDRHSTRFTSEILQFTVKKAIFVGGFEFLICSESRKNKSLTFECQLIHSEKVLQTTIVNVQDEESTAYRASFPQPVLVEKDKFYSLSLRLVSQQTVPLYSSSNGKEAETIGSVEFKFTRNSGCFFSKRRNVLISSILFNET